MKSPRNIFVNNKKSQEMVNKGKTKKDLNNNKNPVLDTIFNSTSNWERSNPRTASMNLTTGFENWKKNILDVEEFIVDSIINYYK